jgi:hypothetical protein
MGRYKGPQRTREQKQSHTMTTVLTAAFLVLAVAAAAHAYICDYKFEGKFTPYPAPSINRGAAGIPAPTGGCHFYSNAGATYLRLLNCERIIVHIVYTTKVYTATSSDAVAQSACQTILVKLEHSFLFLLHGPRRVCRL